MTVVPGGSVVVVGGRVVVVVAGRAVVIVVAGGWADVAGGLVGGWRPDDEVAPSSSPVASTSPRARPGGGSVAGTSVAALLGATDATDTDVLDARVDGGVGGIRSSFVTGTAGPS